MKRIFLAPAAWLGRAAAKHGHAAGFSRDKNHERESTSGGY